MRQNSKYLFHRLVAILLIHMAIAGHAQENKRKSDSQPSQTSTNLTLLKAWKRTDFLNVTDGTISQVAATRPQEREDVVSDGTKIKLKIITMSVAAIGTLFNTSVIMAILIDPLKILRKGAWITILNLAFADLISCISCFCVWGRSLFQAIDDSSLNVALIHFGWGFGVAASFLLLTFLTMQIYVLTKFPLKSRFIFTDVKIVLSTLVIWLFAFLLGLCQLAYRRYTTQTSLKIYTARIGVLQLALSVQVFLNAQVRFEIMKSGRTVCNAHFYQYRKHRNMAKTVIILTLILFVTAFPYFILKQIEYLVRLEYFGTSRSTAILRFICYCYVPITVLNFTANPILYSLRLPDYRKTLFAFFGRNGVGKQGSKKETTHPWLKLPNAFSFQRPHRLPPSQKHRAAEQLSLGTSNTTESM